MVVKATSYLRQQKKREIAIRTTKHPRTATDITVKNLLDQLLSPQKTEIESWFVNVARTTTAVELTADKYHMQLKRRRQLVES